mgnify:CR=1 FL=1
MLQRTFNDLNKPTEGFPRSGICVLVTLDPRYSWVVPGVAIIFWSGGFFEWSAQLILSHDVQANGTTPLSVGVPGYSFYLYM